MENVTIASGDAQYERLTSDYIQVLAYGIFVVVGLPINLWTLTYMLRRYQHAKSLILLLHINLNISDILVLTIYCTGSLIWTLTYEWRGGPAMCKVMRFMDAFVFSFSSNIMVCIALYRFYALRRPLLVSNVGRQRVPKMVIAAWALAALFSSPQLFVWKQFPIAGMTQCLSIWSHRIQTNASTMQDIVEMNIYSAAHLLLFFYLPLIAVVVCYVQIMRDVYRTLAQKEEMSGSTHDAITTRISSLMHHRASIGRRKPSFGFHVPASITVRPMRGQERLQRAKIRSLRITLLLILTYVITWLPYNVLSWWSMLAMDSYRVSEDVLYFLNCLVVLNSVINPFIYGQWSALVAFGKCSDEIEQKRKSLLVRCRFVRNGY